MEGFMSRKRFWLGALVALVLVGVIASLITGAAAVGFRMGLSAEGGRAAVPNLPRGTWGHPRGVFVGFSPLWMVVRGLFRLGLLVLLIGAILRLFHLRSRGRRWHPHNHHRGIWGPHPPHAHGPEGWAFHQERCGKRPFHAKAGPGGEEENAEPTGEDGTTG
jgi:hypothetical protein